MKSGSEERSDGLEVLVMVRCGRFPLSPSPVQGSGLAENIYHAHALLPETEKPDER